MDTLLLSCRLLPIVFASLEFYSIAYVCADPDSHELDLWVSLGNMATKQAEPKFDTGSVIFNGTSSNRPRCPRVIPQR